jgi:hypothetical protein
LFADGGLWEPRNPPYRPQLYAKGNDEFVYHQSVC